MPPTLTRRRLNRLLLAGTAAWALGLQRLAAASGSGTGAGGASGEGSQSQGGTGAAPESPGALSPGEEWRYRLRWGIFTVGEAVLSLGREREPVPGGFAEGYPLRFAVTSSGIAESMYRVRTTITSWLPESADSSLGYRKSQDEGGRKREDEILIDRAAGVARLTSFGEPAGEIAIPERVHDPLSVLFAVRYGPQLTAGERRVFSVTDGRKLVSVDVDIAAREHMTVLGARSEAWRLEPETRDLGGVFRRSRNSRLELWLEDKPGRRPVRLRGTVRVGTFTADLIGGNAG